MPTKSYINFGVNWHKDIDITSQCFTQAIQDLVTVYPSLEVDPKREEQTISVHETQGRDRVRHIQFNPSDYQAACAVPDEDEQMKFIDDVAKAVKHLPFSLIDLQTVDLRYIFEFKHWGNHHALAAEAFLSTDGFTGRLKDADCPIIRLDTIAGFGIPNRSDLVLVVKIEPKTSFGEVTTGEYDGDNLVVTCGLAKTKGFLQAEDLLAIFKDLQNVWKTTILSAIEQGILGPLDKLSVSEPPPANKSEQ